MLAAVAGCGDLRDIAFEIPFVVDIENDLLGDLLRDRCRKERRGDLLVELLVEGLLGDAEPLYLVARGVGDAVLVGVVGAGVATEAAFGLFVSRRDFETGIFVRDDLQVLVKVGE